MIAGFWDEHWRAVLILFPLILALTLGIIIAVFGLGNDLLSSFLPNLLSDLLVGGFLATGVAVWIMKSGLIEQRRHQRRLDRKKALDYLNLLKTEVDPLAADLPELMEQTQKWMSGEAMDARGLFLQTPVWDILQPSGELPRLIQDHELLAALARFYDCLAYAKRGVDRYLSKTKAQTSDLQSFLVTIEAGFKNALDIAEDLPGKLDSGIQSLSSEVDSLTPK